MTIVAHIGIGNNMVHVLLITSNCLRRTDAGHTIPVKMLSDCTLQHTKCSKQKHAHIQNAAHICQTNILKTSYRHEIESIKATRFQNETHVHIRAHGGGKMRV